MWTKTMELLLVLGLIALVNGADPAVMTPPPPGVATPQADDNLMQESGVVDMIDAKNKRTLDAQISVGYNNDVNKNARISYHGNNPPPYRFYLPKPSDNRENIKVQNVKLSYYVPVKNQDMPTGQQESVQQFQPQPQIQHYQVQEKMSPLPQQMYIPVSIRQNPPLPPVLFTKSIPNPGNPGNLFQGLQLLGPNPSTGALFTAHPGYPNMSPFPQNGPIFFPNSIPGLQQQGFFGGPQYIPVIIIGYPGGNPGFSGATQPQFNLQALLSNLLQGPQLTPVFQPPPTPLRATYKQPVKQFYQEVFEKVPVMAQPPTATVEKQETVVKPVSNIEEMFEQQYAKFENSNFSEKMSKSS